MKIALLTARSNCKSVQIIPLSFENTYIYDSHEIIPDTIDIVFVMNYDRIIPSNYFNLFKYGIIVIHSSDLPKGRGWAPIYNSINNGDSDYVISAIKIDQNVDKGDIILKIRIKKPKFISNNNLREIDEDATILIINKILKQLLQNNIEILDAKPQNEDEAKYNKKRNPNDNLINTEEKIGSSLLHILATNADYPAFVVVDGEKVYLSAVTEKYYKLSEMVYNFEK